jgi:hypothetical protein
MGSMSAPNGWVTRPRAGAVRLQLLEFDAHVRERPGVDGSARIRVALLRPRDQAWAFGRAPDETIVINGSAARQVYVGRRDMAAGLADAAAGPIALQRLHTGLPLNGSQNSSGAPIVDHGRTYCFTRNPSAGRLSTRPPRRSGKEERIRSPVRLCRADRRLRNATPPNR